jgi:hypothetical protein
LPSSRLFSSSALRVFFGTLLNAALGGAKTVSFRLPERALTRSARSTGDTSVENCGAVAAAAGSASTAIAAMTASSCFMWRLPSAVVGCLTYVSIGGSVFGVHPRWSRTNRPYEVKCTATSRPGAYPTARATPTTASPSATTPNVLRKLFTPYTTSS